MKWIFNILVSTAITLMVSPLASGGSFDPVTAAYTTNQITASVTPRTVTASSAIIANGEIVYHVSGGVPQEQASFYWGPHAHTMNSAAIATAAASNINALGGCTASASGTSLTISGCFSYKGRYTIYMGIGATCYSFKSISNNLGGGRLNHTAYIQSQFSSEFASEINPSPAVPIALSSATTTVIFPAVTRQPWSFSTYNGTLTATVSEKALNYVLFHCSKSQGRMVSLSNGFAALNATDSIATTTNRTAYAPTITFSPLLPITDNSVVNIRNITAINILPATTFNTGTISSYRTTYTEQPITVTGSGNLTRDVGANENFNVQESWSCTVTGQIDFRIMRDGTQTNLCTSSGYTTHAITAPQSLTAKWRAQNQTSSGAWNAIATVEFTLP